jgi:hypothetical protein
MDWVAELPFGKGTVALVTMDKLVGGWRIAARTVENQLFRAAY